MNIESECELGARGNVEIFDASEECSMNLDIPLEFFNLSLSISHHDMMKNATLEQVLNFFDLSNLLNELDQNLDVVKNEKTSKENHTIYFNQKVNDNFKKLSIKYHPDRMKNRGGSEKEVWRTTEIQKGVNSAWSILQMLHENFIDNSYLSDQNFKYSTCSMVEISILSNEERLKNLNNKILIELCWLSRIKHEKMIPNINKFLEYSESSIQNFIDGSNYSFEQNKKKALIYFKLYVSAYEELLHALQTLKESSERDKDLAFVKPSVQRMLFESKRNLRMLYNLNDLYRYHNRIFHRYIYPDADKELVLPFIAYFDLIFKCSSLRRKEVTEIQKLRTKIDPHKNMAFQIEEIKRNIKTKDTAHQYCLLHHLTVFYCKGINKIIAESLKNKFNINVTMNQTMTKILFFEILKQYRHYLQNEFHCINDCYEHNIKTVKKDVEKILQDFSSNMRETTRKGQHEIREMQNKIKEDFSKMEEEFKAELKSTEDENSRRIVEMEHKLKQAAEAGKQMKQQLGNEIQIRTKLEVKLREEIKRNSKMEDNLRRKSQNFEEEMDVKILKKFGEITEMENELKKNLEDIIF